MSRHAETVDGSGDLGDGDLVVHAVSSAGQSTLRKQSGWIVGRDTDIDTPRSTAQPTRSRQTKRHRRRYGADSVRATPALGLDIGSADAMNGSVEAVDEVLGKQSGDELPAAVEAGLFEDGFDVVAHGVW